MALPDSGQISTKDIADELGYSNTAEFNLTTAEQGNYVDLNACSPESPDGTGESTLHEWYGYDHNASCCDAFNISAPQTSIANACAASLTTTAYISLAGSVPAVGDYVYTDSGCSSALNGFLRYFKTSYTTGLGANYWIRVDSTGYIGQVGTC